MVTRYVAVAVLLIASATSSTVSPVQKVVQLLNDLEAKVKADSQAEQAAMNEYMRSCQKELIVRGRAIKESTREIQDLSATIEESQAIIAESSDEITSLGSELASKQKELYELTDSRKIQKEDFEFAENNLVDAIAGNHKAEEVLKAGMSLTQVDKSKFDAMKSAVQRIIESTDIVKGASKEKLQSFVQSAEGSESNDELANGFKTALRQPEQKAFESKSGPVLQAIKDVGEKAEEQLSELRKKEMENNHAFEMLASTLNNEIKQMSDKLAAATSTKSMTQQKMAQAQEDLGTAKKTKSDDENYSSTMRMQTQLKAQEMEEWSGNVKGELGAIAKARQIITEGVVALVQTTREARAVASKGSSDEEVDRRQRVARMLTELGREYHRMGFVELATSVTSNPQFAKIQGLIEDMIAKLMSEAAAEASQQAFCEEEMSKSNASKRNKENIKQKHQTGMDQATARIAELTEAVNQLQADIAEADRAQAEATRFRSKENAENTKAASDYKQSSEAVTAAISVLTKYYEGSSFIQVRRQMQAQPELGGPKKEAGGNIISILEHCEMDFTELLTETETAEHAAASAFTKLSEENEIARTQKSVDAESKEKEINALEVSLSHHREDHAVVSEELGAVNAYLEKLKPQCETEVESYAERKAAREAEIEGLKEAVSILTSS